MDGVARLRAFNGQFMALVDGGPIWATEDGLDWAPAFETGDMVWLTDLAVSDSVAVVVGMIEGGVEWYSTDGRSWHRGPDMPVVLRNIGTTSSGFVGVGDETLWTSSDGIAWQEATDANSQHVAAARRLFTIKGETLAFPEIDGTIEVWQSSGTNWSKLGVLPNSDDEFIRHATRGPRGWVVMGWSHVWFSETGTSWERARPRDVPQDALVESVIGLDAGFVAAGFSGERGDVTCGDGTPLVAHTWTSRDGLKWAEMEQSLPDAAFAALYARDQTLYVLGSKQGSGGNVGGVWTAPLPAADRPAQGVEPVREPGTGGCGP
jgi:hypothetical protein